MPVFISLLRGINVGGHRKIPMADLKNLHEGLGHAEVRTYLQSGNVVFRSAGKAGDHAAAIQAAIARRFGHTVEALVFPSGDYAKLLQSNPFLGRKGIDASFLHVTFLSRPAKAAIADRAHPVSGDEKAVFSGGHFFLYCPHGYGRAKLTNAYFERAFSTAATTRNWRTALALQELANA